MRVSDNTGCDLVLKRVGGPAQVTTSLRVVGIPETAAAPTERAKPKAFCLPGQGSRIKPGIRVLLAA